MAPAPCPVDRWTINDLAAEVRAAQPQWPEREIAALLEREVNRADDNLLPEHREHSTPEASISAYEAYVFLKGLHAAPGESSKPLQAAIGEGLQKAFGLELATLPAGHGARITHCHDGDTCTIVEPEPAACQTKQATVSVRISGIDAPEVGAWQESWADGVRAPDNPCGYPLPRAPRRNGWINSKLVENVDRIHLALSSGAWEPKELPHRQRAAFNAVVAATINFTGQLASLALKDLIAWELDRSQAGAVTMIESQIRWTSKEAPARLCGTWQPYDSYGRRLASFATKDCTRLQRYIRKRLPEVMASEGMELHEKYLREVEEHLRALSRWRSPRGVRNMARAIVEGVPSPAETYSHERCGKMSEAFDAFISASAGEADHDIQAMQIITGTVYAYTKYRNQQGALHLKLQDAARAGSFGLWNEAHTFRKLWEIHEGNSRYHPEDCLVR